MKFERHIIFLSGIFRYSVLTSKRVPGVIKPYCLNTFSRSYSPYKLFFILVKRYSLLYIIWILRDFCITRITYLWAQRLFLASEYDRVQFYFENISFQTKLYNVLTFQKTTKMWIFNENRKLRFFVEISTLVEYSICSQNFFPNPKLTFEDFYFLNHVNSTKIEKNIDLSYPS